MNHKAILWFFLPVFALVCAGCSTDNTVSSNSQTQAVMPPPQVRVGLLPSATAPPAPPEDAPTPTIEPTVASAEIYIWPTPDEDAIINQIDSMMDDIDRKLNSQDLNLKP